MMPSGGGLGTAFNNDISAGESLECAYLWLALALVNEEQENEKDNDSNRNASKNTD